MCFAASRVYVYDGLADRFIAAYKKVTTEKASTAGDPEDPMTLLGPVVDNAQSARVMGFIEWGQQHNAGEVLTGGARICDKGFYVRPTVFRDVSHNSQLLTEEIFGPVVIVNTFKVEEEIMRLANDTEFGLMAGMFTQDINRAARVVSNLEAGLVGVDCVSLIFQNATTPFGGT